MASVRKMPNGTFQATVSCGRDANGKQIRKYITAATEKECKSAARRLEQAYEEGRINDYSEMKFVAWAEKYLEITKPPELSPTTYRYNVGCIKNHLTPYFKNKKLGQINDILIKEYIAAKRKEVSKKTEKKLSEGSIKKHIAVLSGMLSLALKKNNPCLGMDSLPDKSKPRYVPTTEEFDRLLNAVEGLWDEIPILLAAWCGMRLGEIFSLKVNDIINDKINVDESRALAEVEGQEEGKNKYEYIDKDPKSENGKRIIAAPEYVMDLIQKRISELNLRDDDYLFDMRPDSYGKRFTDIIYYHNLMLLNKPEGRQAPFSKESLPRTLHIQDKPIPEKITFHSLRHYHATVLYEQHYPDLYAANRLGHDINVLKKIYQRLRLKEKNALDDKIKETFKKPE